MNSVLLEKLDKAGYTMFTMDEDNEDVSLLLDVVNSGDSRLWHMFPAILANVYKNKKVDFDIFRDIDNGMALLVFSYDVYNIPYFNSELYHDLEKYFFKNMISTDYDTGIFDIERGRKSFDMYFRPDSNKVKNIMPMMANAKFEHALSELFSPKQKEIILKKYRREILTKTEKEYYSRVIKKKLIAISNKELHEMAVSLLI